MARVGGSLKDMEIDWKSVALALVLAGSIIQNVLLLAVGGLMYLNGKKARETAVLHSRVLAKLMKGQLLIAEKVAAINFRGAPGPSSPTQGLDPDALSGNDERIEAYLASGVSRAQAIEKVREEDEMLKPLQDMFGGER